MTRVEIEQALGKRAPLSKQDLDVFFELAKPLRVRKNQHLVEQGEAPVYFTLIKEGCVMTYFRDEAKALHVLQFGTSMWWTGDLESFFHGGPSQYGLKAMVESELLLFSAKDFEALTDQSPAFERYFRVLFQNSLISHQQRIKRNISYTAEQKYLAFLEKHPKLELIVPQKYIASYLGITPEFLSKLRRRLAQDS